MRKITLLAMLATSIFALVAHAEDDVYLINPSKEAKAYSQKDLQKRVWELERAVFQLQQKVFQLETKTDKTPSWICKVKGMGEVFSAVGVNKVLAEQAALEKCANANPIKSTAKCAEAVCSQ